MLPQYSSQGGELCVALVVHIVDLSKKDSEQTTDEELGAEREI